MHSPSFFKHKSSRFSSDRIDEESLAIERDAAISQTTSKKEKLQHLAIRVMKEKYRDQIAASLAEELGEQPNEEAIADALNIFIEKAKEQGVMQIVLDDYLQFRRKCLP